MARIKNIEENLRRRNNFKTVRLLVEFEYELWFYPEIVRSEGHECQGMTTAV